MEFLKIWRIIVRRKWLIIITFLIFAATVIAGTRIVTPIYRGEAKILIETSDTISSLMTSLGLAMQSERVPSDDEDIYDTDIALATIRPILEKLISGLNLKDRKGKELKPDHLVKFSILNYIFPQPYVEVEQYEDSDILIIKSDSVSPQEAAKMSNELANLYIDDRLQKTRENYKSARLFIENMISDVKGKYYQSLLEKKDFMIKEETIDLQTESNELLEYIANLKNDYRNNEISISQANENIVLIEKKLEGKSYASSALINQLESKLTDLLVEISGRKIEFTQEHPDILQINREIDTIKQILKERSEVVLGNEGVSIAPIYEDLIKNLKDAYINRETWKIKQDLLKRYIETSQDDLMKIPPKRIKQSEIELSLSVHETVYRNLLEYLTQVGVAESVTLSNIRLVEPAIEPEKPVFPKKGLNYAIGILLGLFWGFSLAFFIEYIDNTIKSPEDIKRIKSLTVLGTISKTKQLRNRNAISNLDPASPVVEAYRTVKNSIRYASVDKPIKSLAVTSSMEFEGKSSIALNVAITLSMEDKSVIVVDMDLRRPSIHKFFKISNDTGITNVLAEGLELEKAIVHTGVKGMDLLLSGPVPPDPSRLIESQRTKDTINLLKERYDMVIIDTPPALAVNDAIVIGAVADGVLLVIESERATFSMVEHVREVMAKAGINLIGVVLNKFKIYGAGSLNC